ncbi:MAG: dipeptidase [Butyrivibrio sp.]|nr:dipeptidase [Acetatifactor muris]MCM1559690.1 dipeptidase [Butyrivibrio sp.]
MRVADMHCDTVSRLAELEEKGTREGLRSNTGHLDLLRMKKGDYLLQNFALFVELERCGDPWEAVCRLYERYRSELEKNSDLIAPVLAFEDIAANEAAGKLSAMLTVEEGAVCRGEIEKLRKLYDMGVRMLTLTWNYPNELGHPNFDRALRAKGLIEAFLHTPNVTEGLTERGREFVAEMENLGMIPDVSHLSDAGFYDVLEATEKPFAASHSDARAVCPNVRNMTDDMIRKLSERGGVMGLNYCADFLEEAAVGERNPGTIGAIVRHAKHIVNVGGMQVLGLGSDFDGIDTHEELPGAESMGKLWEALKAAGFTESQLDMVFCGNVLRVYGDTLKRK